MAYLLTEWWVKTGLTAAQQPSDWGALVHFTGKMTNNYELTQ